MSFCKFGGFFVCVSPSVKYIQELEWYSGLPSAAVEQFLGNFKKVFVASKNNFWLSNLLYAFKLQPQEVKFGESGFKRITIKVINNRGLLHLYWRRFFGTDQWASNTLIWHDWHFLTSVLTRISFTDAVGLSCNEIKISCYNLGHLVSMWLASYLMLSKSCKPWTCPHWETLSKGSQESNLGYMELAKG